MSFQMNSPERAGRYAAMVAQTTSAPGPRPARMQGLGLAVTDGTALAIRGHEQIFARSATGIVARHGARRSRGRRDAPGSPARIRQGSSARLKARALGTAERDLSVWFASSYDARVSAACAIAGVFAPCAIMPLRTTSACWLPSEPQRTGNACARIGVP